jgi:hypothetical protein
MSLLIYSGLLYLLGISIILFYRPELMFTEDGNWKEFGLGRNRKQYTWMPFWLFAIMWAILSYIVVLVIVSHITEPVAMTEINVSAEMIEPVNVSTKAMSANVPKKMPASINEMKSGYYILDVNETVKKGIPKYTYLGPEAPNLIYHNMTESE